MLHSWAEETRLAPFQEPCWGFRVERGRYPDMCCSYGWRWSSRFVGVVHNPAEEGSEGAWVLGFVGVAHNLISGDSEVAWVFVVFAEEAYHKTKEAWNHEQISQCLNWDKNSAYPPWHASLSYGDRPDRRYGVLWCKGWNLDRLTDLYKPDKQGWRGAGCANQHRHQVMEFWFE